MKSTYLSILFFSITLTTLSQISYENRVEFELKDGYYNENISEFGEHGFLISSKKINL